MDWARPVQLGWTENRSSLKAQESKRKKREVGALFMHCVNIAEWINQLFQCSHVTLTRTRWLTEGDERLTWRCLWVEKAEVVLLVVVMSDIVVCGGREDCQKIVVGLCCCCLTLELWVNNEPVQVLLVKRRGCWCQRSSCWCSPVPTAAGSEKRLPT